MRLAQFASAALAISSVVEARRGSDAVLLSKVKTLTLRAGKQTSNRRVPSIPQLRCVGGNARRYHEVDVMRCTNVGTDYDGDDIQWTCQANLPSEFKLGSTEVLCEGYSSPTDPNVLKGSCGVEYKLILTELGEARYGREASTSWSESLVKGAALLFIVGVFGYIIWGSCTGRNRSDRPAGGHRGGWGGGPGGGGGGDWGPGGGDGSDPPPPYTPYASGAKGSSQSTASGAGNQRPAQGGFWTNILTGAAAGYVAGRFSGGNRRQDGYRGFNRDGRGGRWGGGLNNGNDGGFGQQPSYRRSSTPSASTHQSTGFGGTTRR